MQSLQFDLQCPFCGNQFDQGKRKPMILCMAQHTSCEQCVQKLFTGKQKSQKIDCPFKCSKIYYENIQPFRYLKEITETKLQLKKVGSILRKERVSMDTDKKMLIELLQKEKEKNEWLIQLNQKKENNQYQGSDNIVKQLKTEIYKQRLLVEQSFAKALSEMQKRNQAMLQNKFKDYEKQTLIQAEMKKSQTNIELKLQAIIKEVLNLMAVLQKIYQSMQPLQNIEKNLIGSKEFQDLSLKKMKVLKSDSVEIKNYLMSIDEFLQQIKNQYKNNKNKEGCNTSEKKQTNNTNSDKKQNAQKNLQFRMPPFVRKSNPDMSLDFKKQQNQKINRDRSITQKAGKTEWNVNQEDQGLVKHENMLKTDLQFNAVNPNQRQLNKISQSCRSHENLSTKVSLMEQVAVQQKKVASIMKRLQLKYGKTRVSNKIQLVREQIDKQIHLSQNKIIESIESSLFF